MTDKKHAVSITIDGMEYKVGTVMNLPAIPGEDIPAQRAVIRDLYADGTVMYEVVPQDRTRGDPDGLGESTLLDLISGDLDPADGGRG